MGTFGCWYGFIYTKNDSPYALRETFTPQLNGFQQTWPIEESADIEINIPSGGDHIIVLRRIDDTASISYSYSTKERQRDDSDLIELAKQETPTTLVDDAIFKLYNALSATVFYFENTGRSTVRVNFELQMTNLAIQDAPGESTFIIDLKPGMTCAKILKPLEEGQSTGIGMSYSCEII